MFISVTVQYYIFTCAKICWIYYNDSQYVCINMEVRLIRIYSVDWTTFNFVFYITKIKNGQLQTNGHLTSQFKKFSRLRVKLWDIVPWDVIQMASSLLLFESWESSWERLWYMSKCVIEWYINLYPAEPESD